MHGDLTTVLATLRYRLRPRLEAAGIAIDWQVDELPPIEGLTPTTVLQTPARAAGGLHQRPAPRPGAAACGCAPGWTSGPPERLVLSVEDDGRGLPDDGGDHRAGSAARG
ncbi:MAG: hypothetical protein V9G22_13180 [Ottowia sp.]